MNKQTGLAQQRDIKDISSMLLPVQSGYLLLPGVSVAEIVGYLPATMNDPDAPDWFLGNIEWRNQEVPLISYETLKGQGMPAISSQCRIAVLNNSGLNQQLDFFAIIIQGTPRLLRVVPEEIEAIEDQQPETGERMLVSIEGETAIIPDISFMEKAVVDFLELA